LTMKDVYSFSNKKNQVEFMKNKLTSEPLPNNIMLKAGRTK